MEGAAPSIVRQQAHNPTKALTNSEIGPANSLACSHLLEIEPVVTLQGAGLGRWVAQLEEGFVAAQPLTPSMPPLRSIKPATKT